PDSVCRRAGTTGRATSRLLDGVHAARRRDRDLGDFTGRPADGDFLDLGFRAQPEVEAPLVLRAEARAALHLLHLLLAVEVHRRPGADRAAVRAGHRRLAVRGAAAGQVEGDPVAARRHVVAVENERSALVGDARVEDAAVAEVAHGDRAAVVA